MDYFSIILGLYMFRAASRTIKIKGKPYSLSVSDKGKGAPVTSFSFGEALAVYSAVKAGLPGTWDMRAGSDTWEVTLTAL